MRRILILCLTILLICSIFCCPISAEESLSPWDARNVPDEVAELLPDYENAQIVYRYYGSLPYSYAVGSIASIEQSMTGERTPYYMVVTADIQKMYKIENGTAVQQTWSDPFCMSYEMLTHEAIYTVSPDICLESIYCVFNYHYSTTNMLIFYKTDLGDYIYFETEQTQPMLMTVRRYDEYMAAWREYSNEMLNTQGTLMGGRYVLHIDSSSYDWTSPTFDPDAPLPIEKNAEEPSFPWAIVAVSVAVLAAAAVTTVLIIRKKKKKNEEIEPTPEEAEETPQ